jgi:hypothetical protein
VTSSSAPAASTEAAEMGEASVAIPPIPNGNNRVRHLEQGLEDDIKTVVRFFVDGNDRDQSEDETLVWQRLEAKVGGCHHLNGSLTPFAFFFRLRARPRTVGKRSMRNMLKLLSKDITTHFE